MKTLLIDAVKTFVNEDGKIFQELHDLLETFPNRKIIVTNADYEKDNKFGLKDMPYEVFTLAHNPEKTDPQYFKRLLEHFGLTPNEVIYFEHSPEAVKSAQSVGIKSYYFNTQNKDLKALQDFLVKNS